MKRSQSITNTGDGKAQSKVTLVADEVVPGSDDYRKQRYQLLTSLGNQLELSQCSGHDFETMRMFYDGACWVMEFTSTVPERVAK